MIIYMQLILSIYNYTSTNIYHFYVFKLFKFIPLDPHEICNKLLQTMIILMSYKHYCPYHPVSFSLAILLTPHDHILSSMTVTAR